MELKKKVIQFSDLENETFKNTEPTLYNIYWNDVKFEMCIHYKPDNNNAIIFGSGAFATTCRDKFPLFNRITWMNDFDCTCIYYFDPTLYLHEKLTVGWCYGRNDRWYLQDISLIINRILKNLNILPQNALFYGSSGGGFSSIMLATMLKSKASVINPQLSVKDFSLPHLKNLETATLNKDEQLIDERINVTDFFVKENYVPKIHILVNTLADNDIFNQLTALTKGLFEHRLNCADRITIDFYSNEQGHSGMPDKDYCEQIIKQDLLNDIPLTISLNSTLEKGQLFSEISASPDYSDIEYMFSVYKGEPKRLISKSEYSVENKNIFNLNESGKYTINVTGRRKKNGTDAYSYAECTDEHTYCAPVEIEIKTELNNNIFTVTVNSNPINNFTSYACYLYMISQTQPVEKIMYQSDNVFKFQLEKSGIYYTTVFVRSKENANDKYQITIKKSDQTEYKL